VKSERAGEDYKAVLFKVREGGGKSLTTRPEESQSSDLIHGEPGLGKSKTLQIIADRCKQMSELRVGVMERPQSSAGDFYREMGECMQEQRGPVKQKVTVHQGVQNDVATRDL
jgi:hypothetical protein